MPTIRFEDCACELNEGESVLDALLRSGQQVAHSCKAGSCGSCMLRVTEGAVPPRAQAGLKDSWKARGYFLACVCKPDSDLAISPIDGDARVPAVISSLDALSDSVLRLRLHCEAPFDFRAGQYVTLLRADGLARSYSIASLPEDREVELHVRRIPNGRMSGWLSEEARPGVRVHLMGPSGECFYVPGREDQPLLLAGAGTGLAPLYGILRDALKHGHRGPIHLFHGAVRPSGLYLRQELREMAAGNPAVVYTPSVLEADGPGEFEVGPLDRLIASRFPKLDGWRSYVCGDPSLVNLLRKKLFLSGVATRDIYADAFLPSAS